MSHPVNPVHPVSSSGVNEIIGKFGGADQLRNAVNGDLGSGLGQD